MADKSERTRILESSSQSDREKQNQPQSKYSKFCVGILAVVGLYVSQVSSIACVQLMDQQPPDFELNFLRFSVGVLYSIGYLSVRRMPPKVDKENIKWMFGLVLTSIGYNLFLFSHYLKQIPIVTVMAVHQSLKIIFSLILTRIFLKSKMPITKLVICFVTLGGTILTVVPKVMEYSEYDRIHTNSMVKSTFNISDATPVNCNNISETDIVNTQGEFHNGQKTAFPTDHLDVNEPCANNSNSDTAVKLSRVSVFLLAICYTIPAPFSSSVKSIIVSGTSLKDAHIVPLSFWYLSISSLISLIVTFAFEEPLIPDKVSDILLCFGHATSTSCLMYLEILVFQNLDVNMFVVMASVRLPLAFLTQMTVLRKVTYVEHLWMFVTGMVIIVISVVIMPIYEYIALIRKKDDNEKKEESDNAIELSGR